MHITSAEAQVMEALWRRHPLSADDLVAEVGAAQSWGDATVKTLINRLLKKKAIKSERAEGKHGYRPLIERDTWVQAESQGLLDRLFDGQLAPLISHFAQHRPLKADEVQKLKAMIEGLEEKR